MAEVKRNLQIYLNGVALGRFEVEDQCYRRALLKFYNDFYLDATTRREMEDVKYGRGSHYLLLKDS